jgi:thioredoxin 1
MLGPRVKEDQMSESIKHVTDVTYQQDVLEAGMPVLLDFWAPWCGPCKSLAPVFEELAKEYEGKVVFSKMNIDENPDTPSQLGIKGIPTLIFFAGGKEVERLVGFAPKAKLVSKVNALLASPSELK